MRRISLAFALCLAPVAVPAADTDNQALIDELPQLSDKAREQRAADRWLQRALDDLVARYDWPWRKELVFDNFTDGDYEQHPRWPTISGRFWVARGRGLRSRADGRRGSVAAGNDEPASMEQAVIGALLQQALGGGDRNSANSSGTPTGAEPNEIRLNTAITNAFAVETEFSLETCSFLT